MTRNDEIRLWREETGLSIFEAKKHFWVLDMEKEIDRAETIDDIKSILHSFADKVKRL